MPLSMKSDGLYSRLFFRPRWYAEVVVYPPLRRFSFGVVVQAEDQAQFLIIGLAFLRVTIGKRQKA